jgi:PadR family transcriptional regulator, regulatory protein PadR
VILTPPGNVSSHNEFPVPVPCGPSHNTCQRRQPATVLEVLKLDGPPNSSYNVAHMARTESTGSFEQLVLTAILTLQDAYGVSIHAKVEGLVRLKTVQLGVVYVTLEGLKGKGMVSSRLSEPTAERGGRSRRCYRMKTAWERALQESAVTAKRIWDSIAETLGGDWARQLGKETS